jgi:hypothetical protein
LKGLHQNAVHSHLYTVHLARASLAVSPRGPAPTGWASEHYFRDVIYCPHSSGPQIHTLQEQNVFTVRDILHGPVMIQQGNRHAALSNSRGSLSRQRLLSRSTVAFVSTSSTTACDSHSIGHLPILGVHSTDSPHSILGLLKILPSSHISGKRTLQRIHSQSPYNILSGGLRSASAVQWSVFLATNPEVRVRFQALPNFLRSSGSGTGSTEPREYN